MTALVRYQLSMLAHSQRYLAPLLPYLGLTAVMHQDGRAPALPSFAVTAGALLVVAAWLTVVLVGVEDPVQRMVTRSHAGSVHRLVAGVVTAVLLTATALGAVSVLWAELTHGFRLPGPVVAVGLLAHVVCGAVGIAIALPCSQLLVPGVGFTVVLVAVLSAAVLLAKWIPLVFPLLAAMTSGSPGPLLVGWSGLAGALVLTASTALTARAFARRVG
ncbi:hypothetical protein [Saccharopolyspora taberi]|uniref:ABC transporter n=1 Tax=Saccharopolyspora taberi TaxID=60895 RepID=A0ABN3VL99_9PSEU